MKIRSAIFRIGRYDGNTDVVNETAGLYLAPVIALSTAFSHERALDSSFILEVAQRAGASALVLHAGLDPARYEGLARDRAGTEVLALESPCPAGRASAAELAACDRDESRAALAAAEDTVRRAAALGARFVVLRLGEVRALAADWVTTRVRFQQGDLDARAARLAMAPRADAGAPHLDAARRALDRLSRAAESAGVTLLLRNGRRYVDLPSPVELDRLLADLRGAPLAPLLDVPAAHLPDVMGLVPLDLTVAAFGAAAPVVYAGDACGPVGALAPGRGIVDLARAEAALPKDALRVFSPWPGLSVDEVVAAVQAW